MWSLEWNWLFSIEIIPFDQDKVVRNIKKPKTASYQIKIYSIFGAWFRWKLNLIQENLLNWLSDQGWTAY